MDKADRELISFCLAHGCKDLDEGVRALENFKTQEVVRLKNEQARIQAEEIENVKHAVEVRRDKLLSNMFAFAQHDRERVAVTINDKRANYDIKLKGYPCPFCNGRLERRDLEWTLEIATGVFPDLLSKQSDSTPTIAEVGKRTTWQGRVRCPSCFKKLAVIIQ